MSLNGDGPMLIEDSSGLDSGEKFSSSIVIHHRSTHWRNSMARGWDSKSVEDQIHDSQLEKKDATVAGGKSRHVNRPPRPSREKEALLLARTRLLRDMQSTENPRYKLFLETSLAAVDKQIAEIQ
jgi:hypothetical protein